MIRFIVIGLIIIVGLMAFMYFAGSESSRERPIDVDPVDSSSERSKKKTKSSDDDVIDVDPVVEPK